VGAFETKEGREVMSWGQQRDFQKGCRTTSRDQGQHGGPGVLWPVILGCLCVLATGCSRNSYWYQQGKTFTQAEQDCRECYHRAQVLASEANWKQRLDGPAARSETTDTQWSYAYQDSQFRRCMKRRGYRLVSERELDKSTKRQSLHLSTVQTFPIAGD